MFLRLPHRGTITTLAWLACAVLLPRVIRAQLSPAPLTPPGTITTLPSATLEQPTPSPAAPKETPSSAVESSVVKVFSTASYPDLYRPWTKQAPREVSGSGVVIEGQRILTNAHVVLHASQVQVQAN